MKESAGKQRNNETPQDETGAKPIIRPGRVSLGGQDAQAAEDEGQGLLRGSTIRDFRRPKAESGTEAEAENEAEPEAERGAEAETEAPAGEADQDLLSFEEEDDSASSPDDRAEDFDELYALDENDFNAFEEAEDEALFSEEAEDDVINEVEIGRAYEEDEDFATPDFSEAAALPKSSGLRAGRAAHKASGLRQKPPKKSAAEDPSGGKKDEAGSLSGSKASEAEESSSPKRKAAKAAKPRLSENSLIKVLARSLAREFQPLEEGGSPREQGRRRRLFFWRQRGAAGTLLLLHALLTIILMIIWAVLPRHVFGIDKLALDGAMFSTLLIQGIAVLLPSFFVMLIYNMDARRIMGTTARSPAVYGLSALIGIPAAVAFTGLNNISLFLLNQLGLHPTAGSILSQATDPSLFSYILMILVTALVPALSEELMFRGVIQTSLALSGRKSLSILLMATAFALYHNDPYFIIAPFCAGLYLGYLREKTDNLYPGIVCHFSMNASLVLLQPILPIFTSSMAFAGTAGRTALYASLIAASVALVLLIPLTSSLYSHCEEQKAEPKRRLLQEQWFPADWKFLLGLFVLFVTMLVLKSV